jgi:hypothetical protein
MTDVKVIPVSDRKQLAPLLDLQSAADAMAAYYALEHPAERVRLFGCNSPTGDPFGFMAVAQTGLDLFRPLAIPFVARRQVLLRLLRDAFRPRQPFLLHLPSDQLAWLEGQVDIGSVQRAETLRLEPSAYEPVLNVLVVEAAGPTDRLRYEIRTAEGTRAAAGVNWAGQRFAEVYLDADDRARGRRLTESVLSALVGRLLGERRIALYRVETERLAAKTEAFHVGFRPTGIHTALAEAQMAAED